MLKRLQERNSVYNVYDWEHDARKQVKLVKNICYHPPSLLGSESRKKKRKGRESDGLIASNEPNRQLYDLYQTSLRASAVDAGSMMTTGAATSGLDRHPNMPPGTQESEGLLPDVSSSQMMTKPTVKIGYETHQVGSTGPDGQEEGAPRFGGLVNKRITTGNGPIRPQQLQPLMPTAQERIGAQSVRHGSKKVN